MRPAVGLFIFVHKGIDVTLAIKCEDLLRGEIFVCYASVVQSRKDSDLHCFFHRYICLFVQMPNVLQRFHTLEDLKKLAAMELRDVNREELVDIQRLHRR